MSDLTLYFDDSGTHASSEIAVAAGYVACVEQWKELERNWKEVDNRFHFGMFHMADFVAKKKQFADESVWTPAKRSALIRELISIVRTRARIGFSAAIFKSDYDKLMPDDLKDRLGRHHYTFAVRQCLSMIDKWRQEYGITGPMQYVFEDGTQGKGEILDTFDFCSQDNLTSNAYGIVRGGYSFVAKTPDVPQLQPPDILAWESNWHMRNSVAATKEGASPQRQSFRELCKSPVRSSFFHEKNLLKLVGNIRRIDAERGLHSLGITPLR